LMLRSQSHSPRCYSDVFSRIVCACSGPRGVYLVPTTMPQDFDLHALQAALDARRAALGLSWAALAAEPGVSAATLAGLGTRPVAEGDGVIRVVAWLGLRPEEFVPGRQLAPDEGRLPGPPAAARLRFDARALYAALDAERAARGLTWREVAAAS